MRSLLRRTEMALFALALSVAVQAHHSTAAFDGDKSVTLTGTVSKVDWVNPHCYVHIVVDDKGQQVAWAILAGTPTLNIRNGWKYDDVKVGDRVTVVGRPSRDENSHSAILQRITLADGRTIAGPREFLTIPTQPPGEPAAP
jgi:hypothetical protein